MSGDLNVLQTKCKGQDRGDRVERESEREDVKNVFVYSCFGVYINFPALITSCFTSTKDVEKGQDV